VCALILAVLSPNRSATLRGRGRIERGSGARLGLLNQHACYSTAVPVAVGVCDAGAAACVYAPLKLTRVTYFL
jgi:hypothetical protein